MKIEFNNQGEFISKLLEEHMGIPYELTFVYQKFFSNFFNKEENCSETPFGFEKDSFNFSLAKLKGYEDFELNRKAWFGVDLPIWIKKGKNERKIMIIAMDPLRYKDNSGKIKPESITFNTPFTIHNRELENNYNSHIVELAENYDVYLTDAYKIFFRDSDKYDLVSNKNPRFRDLCIHSNILLEEINHFNPNFILCLGKDSSLAIASLGKFKLQPISKTKIQIQSLNYSFQKIPVFCVPHASGSARGSAKKFMLMHNQTYSSKNYLSDVVQLILKQDGKLT
jgi:hypothetical protein